MRWYEKIIAAHNAICGARVSHYKRLDDTRYFVWQEDGRDDWGGDNRHAEKAFTGTTDFFTKREFDPLCDALEKAFEENGVQYRLNSIQYEEETGIIHHEWMWSVSDEPESEGGTDG